MHKHTKKVGGGNQGFFGRERVMDQASRMPITQGTENRERRGGQNIEDNSVTEKRTQSSKASSGAEIRGQ